MSTLAMNDPPLLRANYILSPWYSRGGITERARRDAIRILRKGESWQCLRVVNALERGDVRAARYIVHFGRMSGRRPAQHILRQLPGDPKKRSLPYTMWLLEAKYGCKFGDDATKAALEEGVDLPYRRLV